MKTIIAGSRNCNRGEVFKAIIESGIQDQITEVVSGCAKGADKYGEQWAELFHVPVKRFPANWWKYGKAAGPIRNQEMAEYAEALIAVCKNHSVGTTNMINEAKSRGLVVKAFYLDEVMP